MFSRTIALIVASWLPCLAAILPFSPGHAVNATVAGLAATLFAGLAMVNDRARFAASLLGAYIAFTPLFSRGTLLEMVVQTCWGVTMFVFLGGPFSAAPVATRVAGRSDETHAPDDAPPLRAAA
jgi:hypothetical protein